MHRTITVCDLCGKETNKAYSGELRTYWYRDNGIIFTGDDSPSVIYKAKKIDICADCYQKFFKEDSND